jgi:hypothetical protein
VNKRRAREPDAAAHTLAVRLGRPFKNGWGRHFQPTYYQVQMCISFQWSGAAAARPPDEIFDGLAALDAGTLTIKYSSALQSRRFSKISTTSQWSDGTNSVASLVPSFAMRHFAQ